MSLSSELISQFVKITNDKTEEKKETTVYGKVVEYNGKNYVQLDGSDLLTPMNITVDAKPGERVAVLIKNHTATITGNISSPSARTADVKDLSTDAEKMASKITEFEIAIGNKIDVDDLVAANARIDELVADNVNIKDSLTARNADIDELQVNVITIQSTLEAHEADIEKLKTDKLDATIANITYATITNLEATNAEINNLKSTYGTFANLTAKELDAHSADIEKLHADKLDAAEASITYAKISDLDVDIADITSLQSDIANINTLIFGSASGSVIHSSFANAVIAQLGNAQIKSAMIENISADKISAGDINTNNIRVLSEDGRLVISDETMQISDGIRVRVQIGKDSSNDYSINVWDSNGNLMFSKGGITDKAIKDAIIRNDMISDTANIDAHKLNINSLFEEINGSSKTIKSSKIYLDDKNQTLDVAFEAMSTNLDDLGATVTSQGTQITVIQNQISSKVWKQDINEATNTLSTQYSLLEQNLNNISSTVSNTYATKAEVSRIEIGGRNLLLNTKTFVGSNITGNSIVAEEIYKGFTVRTKDFSSATEGTTDMLTFTNIYPDKLGEEYTFSFYAKGTGKLVTYFYGSTNYVRIAKSVQSNGIVRASADGATDWNLTDEWTRYWVTWTLADVGDISVVKWILFRLYHGGTAYICGAKLEKGNKVTDWSPAPEDIDAGITKSQNMAEAAQTTANQNAEDMANIIAGLNNDINNLQTQIDGSITTWFYAGEPTNSNEPAINWTTTDLKNIHLSDLYYDTNTGYCYRWMVQNNTYHWQPVKDTDVTKALADAQTAKDTADQKRRVFYNQPSPPYDMGDLWVQGSSGDILRCQTAKTNGQSYLASDWVAASKYTDDTKAILASQQANAAQQAASTAQSDIDNLKIGGRNILPNSRGNDDTGWIYPISIVTDEEKGYCIERDNTTSSKENYIGTCRTGIVEPSTEYTFSADIWVNEYFKNYEIFWLSDTKDNPKVGSAYVNVLSKGIRTITPNVWTRVTWTFTTKVDDYTGYIRFDNNGTTEEGTPSILRVANLKLEKGNRATDWTPAPEDLEERVTTAETKIFQNEETITSLANRTTVIENKFAGYSTTEQMNSAIEQSATYIKSSVSETYTTKTDFNNLKIGGRNLVAGTDETREYVGNASGSTVGYKDVWTAKTINPPTGTEYIISFDAKADVAQLIRCYFYSPNTTVNSEASTGYISSTADGVSVLSITTEWKRYWVKWTQTPTDTNKSIIIGRNSTENDIYIRKVKLEEGHKATDWTPAPEDMATADELASVQSSVDLAEERVTTTESLIEQLSDCISMLVTDGNGESLMTQTANGWTFSTKQIQDVVDNTSENLDALTNEVGDINSSVDILQQAVDDLGIFGDYIKITTYENEPCIELGEADSDFKLLITNTRIMFMEGTGVPAYINNQSLFIKRSIIEEELQQGEFVWKARSNGNLGLTWKGGE